MFVCTNRLFEKGSNWAVESRTYVIRRKWRQRFHKYIEPRIEIPNIGNFYFGNNNKSLPIEGSDKQGSALGPFTGKKYIEWVLESTSGKVKMYCHREWVVASHFDSDICTMHFEFSSKDDLILYKLTWM